MGYLGIIRYNILSGKLLIILLSELHDNLKKRLHGQQIVVDVVVCRISGHIRNRDPEKILELRLSTTLQDVVKIRSVI